MEKEIKEELILIARRQAPGDNWRLVTDGSNGPIYASITDALEAYYQKVQNVCDFKLSPRKGELYSLVEKTVEVQAPPPKKFNLYGDY